ncbi:competence protein [Flavobacterium sp. GSP27]|uniref:Competence protein n=1 Tax=Flavobacterium bomense TaxID=2497483 RepID=A0A432CQZ2_9FLAO|nr:MULTISPECIES: competence protein [Flavobacterium]RTY96370.1 competence protein [Flavobacterium sp. GSN2]RTY70382.1 competence protein [Flavobacterium sp. LB2P53]RTY76326.1 competence protein [Flavobacterium sp. LS1R10]RTY81287.1 competence protein [Flavobacterium sp. ZB4P23]RTY85221.1 competence protein [Flavobacterium sp. LS1P28]
MAFEELKENTENIQEQAKEYLEATAAYYKLRGFKLAMKSTTMIIKMSLILLCFSMVLLFCSVAAAFAIGIALDSYAYGFLIVGGIYLVLTMLLFTIKDRIIEGPILEKFSEIFFND